MKHACTTSLLLDSQEQERKLYKVKKKRTIVMSEGEQRGVVKNLFIDVSCVYTLHSQFIVAISS